MGWHDRGLGGGKEEEKEKLAEGISCGRGAEMAEPLSAT